LEIANTKNYDTVKIMVKNLPKEATAEDIIALLEESEVDSLRLADILKEKEEKKHWEEEQQKLAIEQEQQRIKQLEEEKQKAEAEERQQ
jgi:hypothetical protein